MHDRKRGFLSGLFRKKSNPGRINTDKTATKETTEFDALLTGQLIAYYKKDNDKKYMNEYIRRLVHIGFSESEAFQLFSYESLNMKHDSIALLQSPSYLTAFYFNLKHRLLPHENQYYIARRMFSVSEITKIWDEAEWHYHNSHEKEMPADVWQEICRITRYHGGELFAETLKSIAENSQTDISKIQEYSMNEQNMLFKYRWNKSANEPHPYH